MKDNTNNKEFWNNYVFYWENKVAEANEDNDALDKTVDDTLLEDFFNRLDVKSEDKLLDYGCGFGRLYPVYRQNIEGEKNNYFGIDISRVSLEHAQIKYSELKIGNNLLEFDGERIPFKDNCFDRIVCFSVFDAVNQEKVLAELLRVLRPEGLLLITGKNSRYFRDDDEAYIAEVNARKKEHPNSFTDVLEMERQLNKQGVEIYREYYFLKRCDFSLNEYVEVLPGTFYQWALILKKATNVKFFSFQSFSNHYSETYWEVQRNSRGREE